ncbi:universal stress protein [Desulfovibrio ferrophilus]|uniref:UspA domain protein n=1 Tax=Desulfovibrio ferrophilus TaxID=241368 RepID=A0A2Z6B3Q1_9BACT|nr:universal stress protein [Desulfovibrio ferrophilus]BBD10085.1 UspA domain protein [Desulfovibrio ferrophilus]
MFKKILFATSASPACDDAARVAFDLAGRYSAELVALHITGVPTRAYSQVVKDVRTGEEVDIDENYLALIKEEISSYYEKQISTCPQTCQLEIATGHPHREILRKAREIGADLIIMGASTRGEEGKFYRRGIAGSTLQRVAKAARCPVLSVSRPSASYWGGFGSVVFATDFSKPAESAFNFASKTAQSLDCDLHLFHSVDISSLSQGREMDQEEIEDKIIEARKRMHSAYASKLPSDFKKWEVEVWEGTPYVEVVKFAREKQADLIVLAHHASDPDLEAARMGSTMEQVILRATCPVVSVNHPDKV